MNECLSTTYDIWMSLFISTLSTSPSKNLGLKLYIFRILSIIFRDLKSYASKSFNQYIFILFKAVKDYLPIYLWHEVQNKKIEDFEAVQNKSLKPGDAKNSIKVRNETDYGFELENDYHLSSDLQGVALELLELTSILVFEPKLNNVIAFGLLPLANLIIFYCLMTKEEIDMWHTDPNQYIATKEDIMDCYDYNIRDISLKTFSNIIEKYKNDAIQIIMVVIDSLIFQNDKSDVKKIYNNMISSAPTYVQKSLKEFDFSNLMNLNLQDIFPDEQKFEELKSEVALLILGQFAEDIVAYQENSGGFDFLILYKS